MIDFPPLLTARTQLERVSCTR